tara:strand:- start:108 stop:374 length:267 start_codon:yes stop_codon:yes gene_type:complete
MRSYNTNADVITEWWRNRAAHNPNRSLSTDGSSLFSYELEIGYTDSKGRKIAINHRSPDNFRSKTTSKHVAAASRRADSIIEPESSGD